MNNFAKIFKQIRLENGMTQQEMAQLLGVSRSAIGMYETNDREPNLETVILISEKFKVSLKYLLTGNISDSECYDLDKIKLNENINARKLFDNYKQLNTKGKKEANKRVEELTEISKYTTPDNK